MAPSCGFILNFHCCCLRSFLHILGLGDLWHLDKILDSKHMDELLCSCVLDTPAASGFAQNTPVGLISVAELPWAEFRLEFRFKFRFRFRLRFRLRFRFKFRLKLGV